MKDIKKISNKDLAAEYISLYQQIEVAECFGTRDLLRRDELENEIARRGGQICPRVDVIF
jgi:hypothetical protein